MNEYTENSAAESFSDAQRKGLVKFMAIICYATGVGFLLPILMMKDKNYLRMHANNGLVLLIFGAAAGCIPFVGWAFEVFILVCEILGIVHAAKGENYVMPWFLGKIHIFKPV